MPFAGFRFERFHLDPANRRLTREGDPVELNARYLDALALLVRDPGQLISKDRFMAEVWRGVPVTDEALTQCIRTLRRQLGDDAANPRFIETVPKHGYRFIAPVENADEADAPGAAAASPSPPAWRSRWDDAALTTGFGIAGGSIAGLIGGLIYGFIGASQPFAGTGAASVLLVLLCVTLLLATIGAAGVSVGIAAANALSARPWRWSVIGGAAGGLVTGAVGKLLGLDAFALLLGQSPGDITGATEGTLLGGGAGLALWLVHRSSPAPSPHRGIAVGAVAGAAAGLTASLLGGRLLAGSLALLAAQVPASRLRLDQVGALFGESGFGPISLAVTATLEGALFGGCIVGAMLLARRERGSQ